MLSGLQNLHYHLPYPECKVINFVRDSIENIYRMNGG